MALASCGVSHSHYSDCLPLIVGSNPTIVQYLIRKLTASNDRLESKQCSPQMEFTLY